MVGLIFMEVVRDELLIGLHEFSLHFFDLSFFLTDPEFGFISKFF